MLCVQNQIICLKQLEIVVMSIDDTRIGQQCLADPPISPQEPDFTTVEFLVKFSTHTTQESQGRNPLREPSTRHLSRTE